MHESRSEDKTGDQTSGIGRRRRAALADGQDDYTARRAAIIRVAAEVFRDKGFERATLGDIAERFGIDRASLYYYVGSKSELFREAVQRVTDDNAAYAEEILKMRRPARERIQLLIEHQLESYERTYPYVHVYWAQDMTRLAADSPDWLRQMERQARRVQSITMQLISEGIEEGSFRSDVRTDLVANAMFGMINWTHRWLKPGGPISTTDVAEAFSTIFFDGLRSRAD